MNVDRILRAGRRRRGRTRATVRSLLLWLVPAGLLIAAATGLVLAHRIGTPYKGYMEEEQVVRIAPGRSPAAIARRLARAGVVRDAWTFRLTCLLYGRGRPMADGEYRFRRPLTMRQVIHELARGGAPARLIRVPPGLTLGQLAEFYESRGLGPAAELMAAAADESAVRHLDAIAWDLEGYLFPDVYALPPGRVPATLLVEEMVERFREVFEERLQAPMIAQALDPRDLVTLASIIEKETRQAEERAIVAAVYANRLRLGMILQADPTVIYARARAGLVGGRLSQADLRLDSPYNTYRYPGLPPGPIASPGLATLLAVLNPANVDYLFFVSRNDGTHAFSRTLAQHNENVYRFQILPFLGQRRRPSMTGP